MTVQVNALNVRRLDMIKATLGLPNRKAAASYVIEHYTAHALNCLDNAITSLTDAQQDEQPEA